MSARGVLEGSGEAEWVEIAMEVWCGFRGWKSWRCRTLAVLGAACPKGQPGKVDCAVFTTAFAAVLIQILEASIVIHCIHEDTSNDVRGGGCRKYRIIVLIASLICNHALC